MRAVACLLFASAIGSAAACSASRDVRPLSARAPATIVLDARLGEVQQQLTACRALREKPLSFPREQRLGADEVMVMLDVLSAKRGADGGVTHAGAWLGLSDDELAQVDRNLNTLGHGLAAFSARPTLPWVFGVVDLEQPALLSAGGGVVLVTSGLLAQVQNEAQLAMALALGISSVAERRDEQRLREGLERQCTARLVGRRAAASFPAETGDGGLTGMLAASTERMANQLAERLNIVAAARYGEVVDVAVKTVAFAGYQPLEGAWLFEALPGDSKPLGLDGAALSKHIQREVTALGGSLHLTAPPSPAAELIRAKLAAR